MFLDQQAGSINFVTALLEKERRLLLSGLTVSSKGRLKKINKRWN
jgi:hypothetical protein